MIDEMFYLIQKRRSPQVPLTFLLAALVVFIGFHACAADPSVDPALVKHFESKVRPLLLAKCVDCHGAENQEAELRVDTAAGIFRGGKTGPIIVPGKPDESLLLIAVRRLGELKMPPDDPLSAAEISELKKWIAAGAIWPGYNEIAPGTSEDVKTNFTEQQKSYWAFQAVVDPPLPSVPDSTWCTSPIDTFILSRLAREGLRPAIRATRRTLIRRIYFDLIGIPPDPLEIDSFLSDSSPDAVQRLVDRLMGSPHYGERWGRHWLDVARYSDTTGQEADWVMRFAYRYRDFVIDSLNRDKPYDQFIIEQLAGDLLPPTNDVELETDRLSALGFLMLSPKATAEADKELMVLDVVDEQIDVTGRAFLGLTIACARCHDHKFDPIPTLDYYSIAGIFRSTETMVGLDKTTSNWVEFPLDALLGQEQQRISNQFQPKIKKLQDAIAQRGLLMTEAQTRWEQGLKNDSNKSFDSPDDMIVYCPLDDGPGDVVVTPTHGTAKGDVQWVAGQLGGAVQLNGKGYIEIGDVGDFERTDQFSCGAWIYPTSDGMNAIVAKMDDVNESRGWDLWLRDGRVYVHMIHQWKNEGGDSIRVNTHRALPLDKWYHVMATYDGSSKAAGVTIYVNGIAESLDLTHDHLTGSIQTDKPLCIGRRTPGNPFHGKIDEVKIFDRELSLDEVGLLAESLPTKQVASPQSLAGLHAWYTAESLTAIPDGQSVGAWSDSSKGGAGLVLSGEPDNRPTFQAEGFHGHASVHFSPGKSWLKTEKPLGFSGTQSYTMFVVLNVHSAPEVHNHVLLWGRPNTQGGGVLLEIDSLADGGRRLDVATGQGNDASAGPVAITEPQIWSIRYSGGKIASHVVKVNGEIRKVTPAGKADELSLQVTDDSLILGGDGTDATRRTLSPEMDLAEVVVFNRVLEEDEEWGLGLHFTHKYSLNTHYGDSIRRLVEIPPEQRNEKQQQSLRQFFLSRFDEPYKQLQSELVELKSDQAQQIKILGTPMVMAVREQKKPADLHVYIRGDYNQQGQVAPRRFLQIIAGEDHQPIQTKQSGRLELARWIADSENPLTARVMVNRMWQGHFGRGIVPASDNFGVLGGERSHPQLLDWLAARLVERQWSLKAVHRMMVASSTYQQAWVQNPVAENLDPENRLHWRRSRRRLEAEPIRDAMLVANGKLDRFVGGLVLPDWWVEAEIVVDADAGLTALAEPAAKLKAYESTRRSVYLPISRNQLYEMFRLFDYADASSVLASRDESTVAPQALFMLNNEFVIRQAAQFADLLLKSDGTLPDEELLKLAHVRAFGRLPTTEELLEAVELLNDFAGQSPDTESTESDIRRVAWQEYCHILFCQNEFIYVE